MSEVTYLLNLFALISAGMVYVRKKSRFCPDFNSSPSLDPLFLQNPV